MIFSLLIFFSASAWSLEAVSLLEVGPSKKTVIVNFGSFDGVKEGDSAQFLYRQYYNSFQLKYVAQGEAIKVFSRKSYWYLSSIEAKKHLQKGEHLILAREGELLRGRRKYRVLRKKIISVDKVGKKRIEILDDFDRGYPKRLEKKSKDYVKEDQNIVEGQEDSLADFDILDLAEFKKGKPKYTDEDGSDLEALYISELQKGPDNEEVTTDFKEHDYQNALSTYFRKSNDPKLDLDELYDDQRKEEDMPMFRVKPSVPSLYDNFKDYMKRKEQITASAAKKIAHEGTKWSDKFSDDALRSFMLRKGVKLEEERQIEARYISVNHQLYFSTIFDVTAATNQSRGYGIGLGYELPCQKVFKIDFCSFGINYKKSKSNYAINSMAITSSERVFKIYMNYYPFRGPSFIGRPIFLLGAGYKKANIGLNSNSLSKAYDYNYSSIPSAHAGLILRFKSAFKQHGFGLRTLFEIEKLSFKTDQTVNSQDNLPKNFEMTDMKFEVGLSYYF